MSRIIPLTFSVSVRLSLCIETAWASAGEKTPGLQGEQITGEVRRQLVVGLLRRDFARSRDSLEELEGQKDRLLRVRALRHRQSRRCCLPAKACQTFTIAYVSSLQ